MRHFLCFESLTPELRMVCPSPSSQVVVARCWISSAPRFEGFTVPAVQTQAQSHWEAVRSSGAVRISLAVMTPHCLRCGRLFFPAGLSMKELSFFSVAFWLRATMSRSCRLSRWSFWSILCEPGCPGYHSVSSLLKTLAVALVLKSSSWRKHTTFLLSYMRVLARKSLETFHLSFVVPAFGPGLHLGHSPRHTCPSRTPD